MKALTVGFVILLTFAPPAAAQDLSLSLGSGQELSRTVIGLIALMTVLSLVPGLAVMITCFPLVVTVMSILRQALGLQQAPPNMLIVALSLFLTWYVMEPVLALAWADGIGPFYRGEMTFDAAISPSWAPFRDFMMGRVDPDVLAKLADLRQQGADLEAVGPDILVPSFMLSEMQKAFQIGFLLFLPFLIIDLIVAAILMSMGMMMVPPAIVALPFKLAFFVISDGWILVSEALVRSYL